MTPSPGAIPVQTEPTLRWLPWVQLALGLPLLVLPAVLFLPSLLGLPRYEVAGGTIVARSLASRSVIAAGTPVTTQAIRVYGRTIGTSTGNYRVGRFSSDIGPVNLYTDGTQSVRSLVFATQPRPTVLTPADPDALLTAWRSGQSGEFRPTRTPSPDWSAWLLLPLLPVVMFLFSRPRVRYELRGDELIVRTAYSTTRFARRDTVASLTDQPLGMRLFGTAMPGYYTGTFASNAGTGGRMQAAAGASRPDHAVVLTSGQRQYYLTPADPQELIRWFGAESAPYTRASRAG